jgi:hypothetical protein
MPPQCTNTTASRANCGGCGIKCDKGEVCSDGACACAGGFKSCGDPAACVNVKVDEANCGDCGNVCAGKCANGKCK